MSKTTSSFIFPNQLFEVLPKEIKGSKIFLIEEHTYFKEHNYHKQKLLFHRLTMINYSYFLEKNKCQIEYINTDDSKSKISNLLSFFKDNNFQKVLYIDPVDENLSKEINNFIYKNKDIEFCCYENSSFINTNDRNKEFFEGAKKFFRHGDFYKKQRLDHKILVEEGLPIGGRWTYDEDNRKKYPKNKVPPKIDFYKNKFFNDSLGYVNEKFPDALGDDLGTQIYPANFLEAKKWFNQFLEKRFHDFGSYEDAIISNETYLNHSVLSALINTGLLDPKQVVNESIKYGFTNNIPMNSIEGFVRQILGWREFIRGIYVLKFNDFKKKNFWKFNRKLNNRFYDGSTGIDPVDDTIKKVLATGYCHHIERLMVLGNFMLLCEINPSEVYRWFMELFIDAYEWVMVPNVYGMSQYADGGLFATKPYISSSNYVIKMSDYKRGEWSKVWDGLFWRFLDKYRDNFARNPRLAMLIKTYDKMELHKRVQLMYNAEEFLKKMN